MLEATSTQFLNVAYDHVRGQIQHEDNLITQRLNWFLTSQSFLFSAYAIVFNGTPAPTSHNLAVRSLMLEAIPLLAVAVAALVFIAILAGVLVLLQLRRMFSNLRAKGQLDHLPLIQGSRLTRTMGLAAPLVLPFLFSCVWIAIFKRAAF